MCTLCEFVTTGNLGEIKGKDEAEPDESVKPRPNRHRRHAFEQTL